MVYGELGHMPMSVTIKQRMVNFWGRLIVAKEDKLCARMYQLLYRMHTLDIYQSPWINYIKDILSDCGMYDTWLSQSFPTLQWLKAAIKLRLTDQYKQEWHASLQDSSKCLNYRIFKSDFKLENYLCVLPFRLSSQLCKFRTCNHHLPIEQGRFNHIPRDERLCKLCDESAIGDEFHYIFKCSYFSD